jgi:hypothetical protein
MFFFSILGDYLSWHYSSALIGYIRIFRNLWWFLVQFFSLPELFSSLFAPYKRITEQRKAGFNLEDLAGVIIINIMSRLIGFVFRISVILVGIMVLAIYTVSAFLLYAVWLGAPLIIISSVFGALYLLWL